MTNEFNADDIFEMAVKIEQNRAVFYRDAAGQVEEKKNKDFQLLHFKSHLNPSIIVK